ncbi:MAG: HAD-IIIA family hydrolase [Desulfobacteraceae bacterium]|nr:HAD-IIIA family hydrolase [Desulfobacteraceae bacterium]
MTQHLLENIRLLLLDADGVLTRGDIVYTEDGGELKSFNVRDGFGIRMLKSAGIIVGVITGRSSKTLERRAGELGVDFCYCGAKDKKALLDSILKQAKCGRNETAFVGDDLPDITIMKSVGAAIAVADAHEAVKQIAGMVTRNQGGQGAVREVCESILKAKGIWEEILQTWG